MTTIAEFANELKQRAAGWRARSHTIFNGAIIAEELQGWADKAAALSPPESTEEQVEAAAQRIYQAHIDHHGLHDLPSWSQLSEDDRAVYRRDASAALRVMPLQNHAPGMLAVLKAVEQRLNESGTGEMGLLDTIHAVYALIKPAILAEERGAK